MFFINFLWTLLKGTAIVEYDNEEAAKKAIESYDSKYLSLKTIKK